MDILPIVIDGADPDLRRSAAAALAKRLGRSSAISDDPRSVVAIDDAPSNVDRHVVPAVSIDDMVAAVHRSERVDVGDGRSYPVIVGPGARMCLVDLLPPAAKRVAVVTQAGVGVGVDDLVGDRDVRVFTVEDGEKAKRVDVAAGIASSFAQWGMTRNDVVVAIGGGVVTDLGGFVASVYHRGIQVIHIATTLLGQIDAAIGGKCGVNLPEGKNLLGSFWQPSAVLCDTDTLQTLPEREYRSGLGELAKYHFLGGGELDALPLVDRVAACVRIKADVVAADEREGGHRAILNYGHTLAHALESAGTYEIRHGEAVATGLVYAAEVAHRLGRIDSTEVAEHRRVVEHYGQSATLPAGVTNEQIINLFSRDKKALDGITFVLDGVDGVEAVRVEDRDLLADALDAMRP